MEILIRIIPQNLNWQKLYIRYLKYNLLIYMIFRGYFMKILLVLILALGLFGVESEEIGLPDFEKPLIGEAKWFIQSAVLAPDGESFYTLKGDLVTQWQLSTIKKILSFKTGIIDIKRPGYQINISNDGKRIILYSLQEIQLWDIKSKKHLKTIKEDLSLGTGSKYGFISLTKDNQVHVWSDKDLTLLKGIDTAVKKCYYSMTDYEAIKKCRALNITNGDNILALIYSDRGLFIDLDTLKIIDEFFQYKVEGNEIRFPNSDEKSKQEQVYTDKYADKFVGVFAQARTYPRSTLKTGSTAFSSIKLLSTMNGQKSKAMTLFKIGTEGEYHIIISFLNERGETKRQIYTFYQFDDGWILLDHKNNFFTGSENMRKYLMMFKDGKYIPMNDETFEKYNKQIDLKDYNW